MGTMSDQPLTPESPEMNGVSEASAATPPPVPPPAPEPDEKSAAADKIIRDHVVWSLGAGLIPLPFADIAAVTAIQMDALQQLAKLYSIEVTEATGKRFVTALTGGAVARLGASVVKAIPGVGSIIGGLSMSALSAASTYAVCQVAASHFRTKGDFFELDLDFARKAYQEALEKGRQFVKKLDPSAQEEAARLAASIRKLEELRDEGLLSEEEFEEKKAQLISRRNAAGTPPHAGPAQPPSQGDGDSGPGGGAH